METIKGVSGAGSVPNNCSMSGSSNVQSLYGNTAVNKQNCIVLQNVQSRRIWEIDLLRTIAIILMVIFHMIFDLNQYIGLKINYMSGFWYWEGKAAALIFIFLAGISSGFSRNTVKRGIKVLALAMVITIATYIFYKEQYIRFGILHFLGTCMILFPLLKRMNNTLLFTGAIAVAIVTIPLKSISVSTGLLIPIGIMYNGFTTLDYYPLLPYLSVFILGIIVYKLYYFKKQSVLKTDFQNTQISMISRNSLAIYLIHQPVLIALVFLMKIVIKSL